ncbi:hypothetical protein [uncultured Shewanella sp.]|uniref:hypothetical protein n=1 Tax=uncultured Shewanella sp. TaxID=173975 RepID=UPI0026332538|nr:hypothetical protein [uncultured Shewanella sp.]
MNRILTLAALIAIVTAFAHLSCIYIGPQCYRVQMAPTAIIESASKGTLLAPIGTIIVSSIFITFGCYALSAAKLIRKLPLLKTGVYSIALLCVIRGLLPFQLWLCHPEKVSDLVLNVGFIWLLVGLLYFFGFKAVNSDNFT